MKEDLSRKKSNSRNLILKEAFKLFLQKNVEKVTVPDLEKATGVQRGTIFYHFKDKAALFIEVVEQFFFSKMNIFYPLSPDSFSSIKDYMQRKNERLNDIMDWFHKEGLSLNPYISFFHLMSQAYLYVPAFEERMLSLLEIDKSYWQQVAQTNGEITTFGNLSHKHIGELLRSIYIERCFIACYDGNPGKKNKLWEDSCISTLDFM